MSLNGFNMIPVYIGYDPRESVAFHVCVSSIIRRSSQAVALHPLALKNLSGYQELHHDGSNQFIYSRFLVPYLQDCKGWAIFIDGDMLLRDDIAKLWALRDDNKAVMVVKHNYKTRKTQKYLGARNENYPRKNWSSVVLWNCGHPANQALTPTFIQQATGAQLHHFTWLSDDLIGELPIEWNWLPDEFGRNDKAALLHWTLGTPCFHECAQEPMAEEWHQERIVADYCLQRGLD